MTTTSDIKELKQKLIGTVLAGLILFGTTASVSLVSETADASKKNTLSIEAIQENENRTYDKLTAIETKVDKIIFELTKSPE
jgi:hypothetical protein